MVLFLFLSFVSFLQSHNLTIGTKPLFICFLNTLRINLLCKAVRLDLQNDLQN